MKPKLLFEQLIAKQDLSTTQMQEVINACMAGEFNDLQIATFLALMRMKGETITFLIGEHLMKAVNVGVVLNKLTRG